VKHATLEQRANIWHHLDLVAKVDGLELRRVRSCVAIWTTTGVPLPLMTIQFNEVTDEDGDYLLRDAVAAALAALARLH
jgi:hypothetical protein